jgi:predicted MFS family arabinose efflux permease
MAAPAAGPPLGGWVVTAASWRCIFGVFVVVAALAVVLSFRWLPDAGHREARRLDVVGWVLAGAGVTVVVVGFRQIADWGRPPPPPSPPPR